MIYQFFEYKCFPDKQSDQLKLPKYVGATKERFNEILSIITKAKKDGLKTNLYAKKISLDNAESLLKGIASRKINGSEFKKPMVTRSEEKMAHILSLLKEIPKYKNEKPDEQPDTKDMPELETEEPADQKRVGLKILTPNQMLSRLPIYFAQLKAGNNSKKLKS